MKLVQKSQENNVLFAILDNKLLDLCYYAL